jgi:sirohydrochlorin cobaltochelatase
MTQRALILFAHGARDPRWAAPFERLRRILQEKLPGVAVELAFLELMAPRLPELVARLAQAGCGDVTVVPVFLGQGSHVLRDLPEMAAQLRKGFPDIKLTVADAAGEDIDVLNAIARYCISTLD